MSGRKQFIVPMAGIAMAHREDEERLSRGSAVFEDLYEYFRKKKGD